MLDELYAQYALIPAELKALRNWCIAGPDKAPYYVKPGEVQLASNQNRDHWKSFDEIVYDQWATKAPYIGFVLVDGDGLVCVDLDYTDEESQKRKGQKVDPSKWTTEADLERYNKILSVFDSYAEVSASGRAVHMWLHGRVGLGAKRDGVEVYSQERFIICTGKAFNTNPLVRNDELLELLVTEVRGPNYNGPGALVEVAQTEDDAVVWERAANAANAEKFSQLVRGEWQGSYKSQSEADLSLMSMFTFYSKSDEQCRRLFRATALGTRDKAVKNDRYLNLTLEIIRGRQAREQIIDQHGEEMARALVRQLQTSTYADVAAAHVAVAEAAPPPSELSELQWPPGTTGALAYFIYKSSPRPVKEIAITAALGFVAGVTGKAFNVYNSGLNLYLILVARSGVGKEALHTGLSLVCEKLRETAPQAQAFIDFTEYASGPALKKACLTQNSFLNVSGEWGRRLRRLAADDKTESPISSLRTEMTNLYQKSGKGNLVGGLGYSNKEQNVATMSGVAYSMVGETTPDTLYHSLTQSMMEDGFLSRFIIVEYDGNRPPLNHDKLLEVPKELGQAISGLCAQAIANNSKNFSQEVKFEAEAEAMLKAFDRECDVRINSTRDESIRQMWNRAHLKVLRVAAGLAVSDNWHEPIVRKDHAAWALELIQRDIKVMNAKITGGDVGAGDDYTRMQKVVALVRGYLSATTLSDAYGVPPNMRELGIIPHRYLQIRTSQLAQFRTARAGATRSLNDCVKIMQENGYIQEVPKETLIQTYKFAGRAYRVVSLPSEAQE